MHQVIHILTTLSMDPFKQLCDRNISEMRLAAAKQFTSSGPWPTCAFLADPGDDPMPDDENPS